MFRGFIGTLLCLFGCMFLCTQAAAEDLRERALQEIQQPGKYQLRSTSASVNSETGMLSLKDPMPSVRQRGWDYFLRLALQTYDPSGNAGNDLTPSRFDLSRTTTGVMPALTVGIRSGLFTGESWKLEWGFGARVAYSSVKGSACFQTGFCEPESQLNTLLVGATPELVLKFARFSKWSLSLGAEIGNLNYTQTSGNNLASFTAEAPYAGGSAGLEYKIGNHWSALTAYTHREITKTSRINIQEDNYELGTRLTW